MFAPTEDAVARIREHLGLDQGEAALYVHLCVMGASKVSDLAEALKLHRNEIYRTAERLEARGLIRGTQDRPARYEAVDPGLVYDREVEGRLGAIESLKRSREVIASLVTQLHPPTVEPQKSTYKVVRGRQEIFKARHQLIENAHASIDWVASFPPGVRLWEQSGERDLMVRRAHEGVQVRVLVDVTRDARPRLAPLLDEATAQLRNFQPPGIIRFLIVDDRELLMYVMNDDSPSLFAEDEVAIQTTAPGFIHAQRIYFDEAWRSAAPVAKPSPATEGAL